MDVYVLCAADGTPLSVHRRRQGADAESDGSTTILDFELQDDDDDA